MPRPIIYLYVTAGAYVAHFHDPILQVAHPDDVLPTGYPEGTDTEDVRRHIADLNPLARVVLGHPPSERLGARSDGRGATIAGWSPSTTGGDRIRPRAAQDPAGPPPAN